jgi:hypothetical protein
VRSGIVWEPKGRGTHAIGGQYQATASEDVTVDTSVCMCNNEL